MRGGWPLFLEECTLLAGTTQLPDWLCHLPGREQAQVKTRVRALSLGLDNVSGWELGGVEGEGVQDTWEEVSSWAKGN